MDAFFAGSCIYARGEATAGDTWLDASEIQNSGGTIRIMQDECGQVSRRSQQIPLSCRAAGNFCKTFCVVTDIV